jgi:hypothetical protein
VYETTVTLSVYLTGYRIYGPTVPLTNSIRHCNEGGYPSNAPSCPFPLSNVFVPTVWVMSQNTLSFFRNGISWQAGKRRLDYALPVTDAMSGSCAVRETQVLVPAVSAMGSSASTARREKLEGPARPSRWHRES